MIQFDWVRLAISQVGFSRLQSDFQVSGACCSNENCSGLGVAAFCEAPIPLWKANVCASQKRCYNAEIDLGNTPSGVDPIEVLILKRRFIFPLCHYQYLGLTPFPKGHVEKPNQVVAADAYRSELAYFLNCVRGGVKPAVTAKDAVQVMKLIEAERESVRKGRQISCRERI